MELEKKNFSQWYNSIIKDAQLCDIRYPVKGFVVFMPWSVLTMKKMYSLYEKELERKNHLPAWFPALIPESFFKKEADHVEGFAPEVLWVTHAGKNKLDEKLAMRPTSETAMYFMYSLWIHGIKELPLKIYHSSQVWRHETKATKPFIRSREFYWIETHNAFVSERDALNQVKEDMEITEKIIHQTFGIPFIFFKRPQWDKFPGAVDTYAADTLMPDGRALQLPSTHMLGQNFAKVFNVKFTDNDGESKYCWQTCYGPAISRIYAALISIHGDSKGLVFPFDLAPLQLVIVPIFRSNNREKVLKKCFEVKESLDGFSVKVDDSENTPGFKYNYWEMKGVPFRIELGERDIQNNSLVLVRRDVREKKTIPFSKLKDEILNEAVSMKNSLIKKADSWFNSMISEAEDLEDLKKKLSLGGFVKVKFCSDDFDGKSCADKIKEKTHGNVRGSVYGETVIPHGNCIACGKKAKVFLHVARQY